MRWASLRLRLVAGGTLAILLALGIAGAALALLFERHVTRTIADDLDVHLRQLLAGIEVNAEGRLTVERPPADPRFEVPLSGLYWQVADDRDTLVRSRSLWDTTLRLPPDEPSPGEIHQHEATGPANARVLIAERGVLLTIGDRGARMRAAVAADYARAKIAVSAFTKDLSIALALLAAVLGVATFIQVALGLRPLASLRSGIADIRAGRRRHLPGAAPPEVAPLVEEVNALLDAQEQEMVRSRDRAADLAHGLKTPLAALITDAERLRARGEATVARDIEAVVESMSRRVDRELARARARGGARVSEGFATTLAPLVKSLVAAVARTPSGRALHFDCDVPDDLRVPLDRADLAEVLGNLLENAARHAKIRVLIAADAAGHSIAIEDDGTGIAESDLARTLQRGVRLDERAPGAGLGLAIVQDVLDAYGWKLEITRSGLGGVKAVIAQRVDHSVAASHAPASA
jgi:signal transduction histidine kinase